MDDATLLVWIDRGRTLSFALVAVGVVGEFLVDRVAGPIIKRRDEAQRAEIARLNKEAGDARKDASEAVERAAKLEREAAELNRKAEEERLARVKIEERLAPRVISGAQEAKLLAALKPLSGKHVSVFFVTGQPETERFARALAASLTKAGLNVQIQPGMRFGGMTESGISLAVGKNRMPDASILAEALVGAELATKPIPAEESKDDEFLQIIVAPK